MRRFACTSEVKFNKDIYQRLVRNARRACGRNSFFEIWKAGTLIALSNERQGKVKWLRFTQSADGQVTGPVLTQLRGTPDRSFRDEEVRRPVCNLARVWKMPPRGEAA